MAMSMRLFINYVCETNDLPNFSKFLVFNYCFLSFAFLPIFTVKTLYIPPNFPEFLIGICCPSRFWYHLWTANPCYLCLENFRTILLQEMKNIFVKSQPFSTANLIFFPIESATQQSFHLDLLDFRLIRSEDLGKNVKKN